MKRHCHRFQLPSSLVLFCLVTASPVCAQSITRDGTLSTKVTSSDGLNFVIRGGDRAGINLFHSFSSFSVPDSGSASFEGIDPGIENVISRVTGSSSNINGLIRMLQTDGVVSSASFFLLNPQGIVFGPNAFLDIDGSFLASTASSLNFANGTSFSTTNAQATVPPLSINTPIGLQFGSSAAGIQVQQGANLKVPSGKTLGLVGGKLTLKGGLLTASDLETGIRIELGSVAAPATLDSQPVQVKLTPIGQRWTLGYKDIQNFQDIQLSQNTVMETTGGDSGSVQVQGRRVTLTDGSRIVASTEGSEPIGGALAVTASESVELIGISSVDGSPSGLYAPVQLEATGRGADIIIETGQLLIQDGARVLVDTFGIGDAGELTVLASEVELVGISDADFPSGLFARSRLGAEGNGGDLTIQTNRLIVRDGAQVATTTFSNEAYAGDLTVNASDVQLSGTALRQNGTPIVSGLFAGSEPGTRGNGGNLTINTDRLLVQDGAEAQVTTLGDGDAGTLSVNALESVELIGKTPDDQFPSGLLAASGLEDVFTEARGQGGNIAINTPQLIARDGAAVTVSSTGSGVAGELNINARLIELDNGGALTAQTALGQGGNINLGAQDLLLLRSKSQISTQSGTKETPGTGGTITINTDTLVALENSDIDANAFGGLGGQVEITAQGVFGTESREQQTLESDITASSDLGPQFSGTVQINTPDVDPSQEIANLPTEPVNTEIAQDCQTGGAKGVSRFISSGSGGLPTNPYEPLDSRDILADVQPPAQWGKTSAGAARVSSLSERTSAPIVEAQGWSVSQTGEIVLVAEASHDPAKKGCRVH